MKKKKSVQDFMVASDSLPVVLVYRVDSGDCGQDFSQYSSCRMCGHMVL